MCSVLCILGSSLNHSYTWMLCLHFREEQRLSDLSSVTEVDVGKLCAQTQCWLAQTPVGLTACYISSAQNES